MGNNRTTIYFFSGRCSKCKQHFEMGSVIRLGADSKCTECEYGLTKPSELPRATKPGKGFRPVAQIGSIPRRWA